MTNSQKDSKEVYSEIQHSKSGTGTSDTLKKLKTQAKILKEHEGKNYLYLFGCRPLDTVNSDTKMIDDITCGLLGKINPDDHTIKLPEALDNLLGTDVNFELSKSAKLTPITLRYEYFEIQKSKGIIFSTSSVNSLQHLDE